MSERVRFHSIIGNNNEKDLEASSDGFVPYWSSHLEGAESELVIASGHKISNRPEAIEELMRILHLHSDVLGLGE